MTDSTEKPKSKRRWLRFNLRSFLIVVTILSAWVGWYVYRAEKQRAAVQWVQENRGWVEYEFEVDETVITRTNTQSSARKWLPKMFGVDYFECVVEVYLRKSHVSDLAPLTGLTNLERLQLWSDQVSDLTPLAGLTNLEKLELDTPQVSDLTPLASLTNLKSLTLTTSQVSDLTPLAGLTNLERLLISTDQVSDLTPLSGLTNLETLQIYSNAQMSYLAPLAGLVNLQELWIVDPQISDVEIAKLRQALPNCKIIAGRFMGH